MKTSKTQKPPVQEIFDTLTRMKFDDDGYGKAYIKVLLTKYPETETDASIIKAVMTGELQQLLKHINKNYSTEFMVNYSSDYKFQHWNCLYYVTARWFISCKKIEELPTWYQNIISLSKDWKVKSRSAKALVDKYLEEMRE